MGPAIFYMHQTSGASAEVCVCNRTHQIEKTDVSEGVLFSRLLEGLTYGPYI